MAGIKADIGQGFWITIGVLAAVFFFGLVIGLVSKKR